ncbi:DEAD/DEAH box helicase [Peribacillus sp. SCS-155]|uniref:DEAD/DEAH box helicase n=1 Tax=Peribacillus sedimenti TaxID=3115297 RepID=UPI003905BB87
MADTPQILSELKPFIKSSWEKSGFENPTPIQLNAIPAILEGRDIIAESPTGTGKTLAYLLPLLEKINPDQKSVQAVILASSRELVMQIAEEVRVWAAGSGITAAAFIGGANVNRQLEKLKKRPQIVAGTPGRINELINMKKLKMHEVKIIVLDEGDQLMVPEHMNTVRSIVKSTKKDRQVVMFSATLPPHTEQAVQEIVSEPELIRIDRKENVNDKVDHIYFVCEKRDKIKVLEKIIRLPEIKALGFVNDIAELTILSEKLQYKGTEFGVLHGESDKVQREKAIKNLRSGQYPILLATDVAARGLDIKGLTAVVHIDLPINSEQYVHRSGRTGRAGASGTVISIVNQREEKDLKRLARDLDLEVKRKEFYKGEIVDER